MKVAKVIGKVSLVKAHPSLRGRRFVLAVPQSLSDLLGQTESQAEELVAIDDYGASEGALIGIADGGEAANPYLPNLMPVDVYTACILDKLDLDAPESARALETKKNS